MKKRLFLLILFVLLFLISGCVQSFGDRQYEDDQFFDEESFSEDDNFRPGYDREGNFRGRCDVPKTPSKLAPPPEGKPFPFKGMSFDHHDWRSTGEMANIKELGANAIILFIDTTVYRDNVVFYDACVEENTEEIYSFLINEAHENGLFVELRQVVAPPETTPTLTTTEQVANAYARKWSEIAKIAQKYNVYQITAFGELDTAYIDALSPDVGLQWDDIEGSETTVVAQETLKSIRQNFDGRIGIGISQPEAEKAIQGLNIQGYDYMEFSSYPLPEDTNFTQYFANLNNVILKSREIADKNNIKELIWGEGGVLDDQSMEIPAAFDWTTTKVTEEQEAEYYDRFFEMSNGLIDGYNIDYINTVFGIKDQKAEEIVKKWFTSIN